MSDKMVLETQQWLNRANGSDPRFQRVEENGQTGWPTIYGLTRALQIELGIDQTADNFGEGTQAKFRQRYPDGVKQQADGDKSTSNIYSIIQGALWCKGYSVGGHISQHFYSGTGTAIENLKNDMGIGGDSTVQLEIMKALLSMQQFVLLNSYGGRELVRSAAQKINQDYRGYTGIIPTDGLYGRDMNTALIQVLQAIEGFSPDEATGTFGAGTRSRLRMISAGNADAKWVWLATVCLICNGGGLPMTSTWSPALEHAMRQFQDQYGLPISGNVDSTTWMSLLTSKGDPDRPCVACDTRFVVDEGFLARLKSDGYQIVGRYLTDNEEDEAGGSPRWRKIVPGELERIIAGGLKYFPIFQEWATKPAHFTFDRGAHYAERATSRASELGVPPTVIYFAVDYDALDEEVDSLIIPFFKGINSTLGGGYGAGIYASRNICRRIIDAGLASSAFVSDMSTGFSGNLGFTIPPAWNYDQFTEISGYGGAWDLDRVAYAGRIPACSTTFTEPTPSPDPDPVSPDTDPLLQWAIQTEQGMSRRPHRGIQAQSDPCRPVHSRMAPQA